MLDNVIEQYSVWIGLVAGLLVFWLLLQVRPISGYLLSSLRGRWRALRSGTTFGMERRYRHDILRLTQNNHIASVLFPLDEIAIPPRLMLPPPPVVPESELPPDDAFSATIPYMPDWPEMSAAYNAPTLTIAEALEGGANLALIGRPGSGKTFTLNYLAALMSRNDIFVELLGTLVPILVHAGDLDLRAKIRVPLDVLYESLSPRVSTLVEARLPGFLEKNLGEGTALLLVDGLDELPPKECERVVDFLRDIHREFKDTRIVVACSTEYIAGLESLDLIPVAMAAWGPEQVREFLDRWTTLWKKYVRKKSWGKGLPEGIDPLLLGSWLAEKNPATTPLSLTLRTWAAFAGDIEEGSEVGALEAYLNRFTWDLKNARPAMEQLAAQMAITQQPLIQRGQAGKFVAEFEDPRASDDMDIEELEGLLKSLRQKEKLDLDNDDLIDLEDFDLPSPEGEEASISARRVRRLLPEIASRGILVYRTDARIGFSHPVVGGYLAGRGLAKLGGTNEVFGQPNWVGRSLSLNYLVASDGINGQTTALLEDRNDDLLHSNLLTAASWPRYVGEESRWRNAIMRRLGKALNDEHLPLGLRGRILAGLAASRDPGVVTLFRQMLGSAKSSVRQLGALGCGMIRDEGAIETLNERQYDPTPSVGRAAAMALIAIHNEKGVELAATALLQAEDSVRRAVAESFSQYPDQGYSILVEASELESSPHVRMASAYGLGMIKEGWAREKLQKLQLDDDQWTVRNAAGTMIQKLDAPDKFIPRPFPPLSDTPWLITFASQRGLGVSGGRGGWQMVADALAEGSTDEKLAAMDRLQLNPSVAKTLLPELRSLLRNKDEEIREAAYHTLWQVAAAGVEVGESDEVVPPFLGDEL